MARRTTEIKEVTKAEYRDHPHGGGASLYVEFDGRSVYIWFEQKLLSYGFVTLGPAFDDFEIILPADPANGRSQAQRFTGFTNDVRILELTKKYLRATEDGSWRPGPVKIA